MIIPNICKNNPNVPNHQPETHSTLYSHDFVRPFYPLYIPIEWLIFLHPTPPLTSWLQHSHPLDCSLPSPRGSESGPRRTSANSFKMGGFIIRNGKLNMIQPSRNGYIANICQHQMKTTSLKVSFMVHVWALL
jgi:hypothetical protein